MSDQVLSSRDESIILHCTHEIYGIKKSEWLSSLLRESCADSQRETKNLVISNIPWFIDMTKPRRRKGKKGWEITTEERTGAWFVHDWIKIYFHDRPSASMSMSMSISTSRSTSISTQLLAVDIFKKKGYHRFIVTNDSSVVFYP